MSAREFGDEIATEPEPKSGKKRLIKVYRSDGRVEYLTRQQLHDLNQEKQERTLAQERRARLLRIAAIAGGAALLIATILLVISFAFATGSNQPANSPAGAVSSPTPAPQSATETVNATITSTPPSLVAAPSVRQTNLDEPTPASTGSIGESATVTDDTQTEQAIEAHIRSWAACWSGQDVACYLDAYSEDFVPEDPNLTHDSWQKLRALRVASPQWIKVSLDDIEISRIEDDSAEVRFLQRYSNPNINEQAHKQLTLSLENGTWLIKSETVLN